MTDHVDEIKQLHTALIDSLAGYKEALADDNETRLVPLFKEMIALRERHHAALDQHLRSLGQSPDESGSFMSAVHRGVIWVRSVTTGLNESSLPGFIDGEERILKKYDEALAANPPSDTVKVLTGQRSELNQKVAAMKAMRA